MKYVTMYIADKLMVKVSSLTVHGHIQLMAIVVQSYYRRSGNFCVINNSHFKKSFVLKAFCCSVVLQHSAYVHCNFFLYLIFVILFILFTDENILMAKISQSTLYAWLHWEVQCMV